MPKRILDTNRLINQFRLLQPYSSRKAADAIRCAKELIELFGTNAIVSPIEIEVLAGVNNAQEMELTLVFLEQFQIVDDRRILPEDWMEARRIAKHIGPASKPRDLGDCLIDAIARRLKYDFSTTDREMKRQSGRTRQRKP